MPAPLTLPIAPVFREVRRSLILRRPLDVVDDDGFDGTFALLQVKAETMHCVEDGGGHIAVLRVGWRKVEVVTAGDAGPVEDRKAEGTAQLGGEKGAGC